MSLLDDVSIVVTPNGYKAGELYAVVPVPSEGAEEVNDKDFILTGTQAENTTGTYWTTGTGWTISSGTSIVTNGAIYSRLSQSLSFDLNSTYQVTIECSQFSNGYVYLRKPRGSESDTTLRVDAVGTFKFTLQALTDIDEIALSIGVAGTNLTISSISVKEVLLASADMDVTRATAGTRVDEDGLVNYAEIVTGSDIVTDGDFPDGSTAWALNGWTISGNTANGNGLTANLIQSISGSANKNFSLTFTISNYISGSVIPAFVGNSSDSLVYSSNGTFTEVISSGSDIRFVFYGASFSGSISNVSLKEVTRNNVPRIDYTGGGCPHILAEPQRTNFVAYSIPDNTNWSKGSNTTITENFSTSPDGTQNASRLVMPTGSGTYAYYQFTATSTTNHTFSFYAKNNGGDANVTMAFFVASQTQSITLTNEWKRFEFTTSITSGNSVQVGVDNLTSIDMLIWGCQCEESYATSYIPTSGSTVTRNQDIFTRDGIGSLINSTEGVLFVEMAALSDDLTNRFISLTDGSDSNSVTIFYGGASNRIRSEIKSGGTTQANLLNEDYTIVNFNKIAVKYKVNDFALWINGTEVATDTSGSIPVGLNDLSLDRANILHFYGKVKQLQVYNTALTDEQLLQLTGESGTDFYESYAEMATALTYTIQ